MNDKRDSLSDVGVDVVAKVIRTIVLTTGISDRSWGHIGRLKVGESAADYIARLERLASSLDEENVTLMEFARGYRLNRVGLIVVRSMMAERDDVIHNLRERVMLAKSQTTFAYEDLDEDKEVPF